MCMGGCHDGDAQFPRSFRKSGNATLDRQRRIAIVTVNADDGLRFVTHLRAGFSVDLAAAKGSYVTRHAEQTVGERSVALGSDHRAHECFGVCRVTTVLRKDARCQVGDFLQRQ